MKKIIFFNSCKVWGGGEKWHLEMATEIAKKDYDVVIFGYKNSELIQKAKQNGLKTKEIKISNLSFLNIFKMFRLKRELRNENADILIMNLPSDVKTAGVMCRINKKTKIIYRRGSAIPIKNSILNRFIFNNVIDYIIANSEETKKTVLKNQIFKEDKIITIYNGINIDKYNNRNYELLYKRENNELIIGNAGRLSYQKNQFFLLDLADELKKNFINFKILIAGDGELKEKLLNEIKKRNLDNNIIFLGFVENIKSFMKSIDIFILPSHWEGFGYVMVEAMLSKKLVIAFNKSSNSEIVENNKTGYLVNYNNIYETYDIIIDFIKIDENIKENMGNYAKLYCEEKFSLEKSVEKFEKFINSI